MPLHTLFAEIGTRDKVFDIARASAQRDAVLLVGASFTEQPVPPVLIGVVDPSSFAFTHIFNDPRPIGMFGFVVYGSQQLFHILFGVLDVFVARVGLPEFVDQEYPPITAVFIVGRRGGSFTAQARTRMDEGFAMGGGANYWG